MNRNIFKPKSKAPKRDVALERHKSQLTAIAKLHNQVADVAARLETCEANLASLVIGTRDQLATVIGGQVQVHGSVLSKNLEEKEDRRSYDVHLDARGRALRIAPAAPGCLPLPGCRLKTRSLTAAEADAIRKSIADG